jgi:hypothetical protein
MKENCTTNLQLPKALIPGRQPASQFAHPEYSYRACVPGRKLVYGTPLFDFPGFAIIFVLSVIFDCITGISNSALRGSRMADGPKFP